MAKGKCDVCQYYSPGSESGSNCGECRFNPPQVVVQATKERSVINTAYPIVRPDAWCGQFKQDHSKTPSEPHRPRQEKQDMEYKL